MSCSLLLIHWPLLSSPLPPSLDVAIWLLPLRPPTACRPVWGGPRPVALVSAVARTELDWQPYQRTQRRFRAGHSKTVWTKKELCNHVMWCVYKSIYHSILYRLFFFGKKVCKYNIMYINLSICLIIMLFIYCLFYWKEIVQLCVYKSIYLSILCYLYIVHFSGKRWVIGLYCVTRLHVMYVVIKNGALQGSCVWRNKGTEPVKETWEGEGRVWIAQKENRRCKL